MAINDIVQTIAEARVDARSLSEFVFKPADFTVTRRLAPSVRTLQFYIDRFNSLNGDFSSSVSVALSSLNNSVAEADGKVAYIETTVQNAINNTAIEGGVLADTFVVVDATLNQRQINRGFESIADMLSIVNPNDGLRVYVKSYHAGLEKGGGYFTYDSSKVEENDGGLVLNGWVRDFNDIITPYFYGAVCDGVTDDTETLQNAVFSAVKNGKTLIADGLIKTTSTIIINGSVDLSLCENEYYGATGTAFEIRDIDKIDLHRVTIKLPLRTTCMNKLGLGWDSIDTTGVKVTNLLVSKIYFGTIRGFKVNAHIFSERVVIGEKVVGQQTVYNEFYLMHLDNGKTNLLISDNNDSSWVNENLFFGGRFSHNGSEGQSSTDVHQIQMIGKKSTLNNNVFLKPSLEGSVPLYHVVLQSSNCTFYNARWEAPEPRVLLQKDTNYQIGAQAGQNNRIDGGYDAWKVIVETRTIEGGSYAKLGKFFLDLKHSSGGSQELGSNSGGYKYTNTYGSNSPIISIYELDKDVHNVDASSYTLAMTNKAIKLKPNNKSFDSLQLLSSDGSIVMGNGTSEAKVKIYGTNTSLLLSNATTFYPYPSGSASLGVSSARWGSVYLTGGVGFHGSQPSSVKPIVTGSLTDGTALKSLLTALNSCGLVDDQTA